MGSVRLKIISWSLVGFWDGDWRFVGYRKSLVMWRGKEVITRFISSLSSLFSFSLTSEKKTFTMCDIKFPEKKTKNHENKETILWLL